MESATESPPESPRISSTTLLLAGLQAGMVGVCWMLAWLGISAAWQRRSFWTAENLMASVFYGDDAIRSGFAFVTLSGLALYLLIYSTLGALFAWATAERLSPGRTLTAAVLFGLVWYFLSFGWLWKTAMPLVALLHTARPTVLAHLVYGTFLGRYRLYLPKRPGMETVAGPAGPPVESGSMVEPTTPPTPAAE